MIDDCSNGAEFFCGGVLLANRTAAVSQANSSAAAAAAATEGTAYWDDTRKVVDL